MSRGLTFGYFLPVAIVVGIAEEIVLLPASPYTNYKSSQRKRKTFAEYSTGRKLLDEKQFDKARFHFLRALDFSAAIAYSSDVYFQIAETYASENKDALAKDYYRMFLDYSVALYPDYFKHQDEKYKNDPKVLDQEFAKAEEKTGWLDMSKEVEVITTPTDAR